MVASELTVKGILFDVYNTLVTPVQNDKEKIQSLLDEADAAGISEQDWQGAMEQGKAYYFTHRHREWAVSAIMEFWKGYYETILQHLPGIHATPEMAERLAVWSRAPESYHLNPEANTVLASLKERGYVVGLLSNWDVSLATFCQKVGINVPLDLILASDELNIRKPDPRIFKHAVKRLNLSSEQCAYVGDSLAKDMAGAAKAGLVPIWFNPSKRTVPAEYSGIPVLIISHLSQILSLAP